MTFVILAGGGATDKGDAGRLTADVILLTAVPETFGLGSGAIDEAVEGGPGGRLAPVATLEGGIGRGADPGRGLEGNGAVGFPDGIPAFGPEAGTEPGPGATGRPGTGAPLTGPAFAAACAFIFSFKCWTM